MRKQWHGSFVLAIMAGISVLLLLACGDVDQLTEVEIITPDPEVTSVTIINAPTSIQLVCPTGSTAGSATHTFTARAEGTGNVSQEFTWSSTAGQWNGSTWTITAAGEHNITATSVADTTQSHSVTVIVLECQPPEEEDRVLTSIDYSPQGGDLQENQSVTAQAVCRDQHGEVMTCPTLTWSSTAPSAVSVSSTGVITCVANGSAEIRVHTPNGGPSRGYAWNCVVETSQNFTMNQSSLSLFPSACPSSGSSTGQLQLLVNGTAVTSGVTWTSSNSNIASVSSSGQVTAHSAGTVTITATTSQGSASANVTVNACPSQNVVLSQTSFNLFPPTCPASGSSTATITSNVPVSWSSSNQSVATVSQTSSTSATITAHGAGSTTITATPTSGQGQSASANVTVNACPSQPRVISVNVQPETFECVVGGNFSLSANVEVEGGASTAVTWSVSNTSIAVVSSTAGNAVVIDCVGLGSVIVTARAVADTSVSDSSTGQVVPGTITCTWTTNSGLQSNGDVIISKGQTITATAVCENEHGESFLPYWYSSAPSRVGVRADQTVNIDGTSFYAGNTATIEGIYQGEAIVSVQAAIDQTVPAFSRKVIVQ